MVGRHRVRAPFRDARRFWKLGTRARARARSAASRNLENVPPSAGSTVRASPKYTPVIPRLIPAKGSLGSTKPRNGNLCHESADTPFDTDALTALIFIRSSRIAPIRRFGGKSESLNSKFFAERIFNNLLDRIDRENNYAKVFSLSLRVTDNAV